MPAPAQLLLNRRRARAQGDDWAASIACLREREQSYIDETIARHRGRPDRRRILVFAVQQTPPWLQVEYSLATALKLRGHEICGAICDGVVPLCEMNLGERDRPRCDVCEGWLAHFEQAFGFDFLRLGQLLTDADRCELEHHIESIPPDQLALCEVDGVEVGRLARRELQRYHRGFVFEPGADPAYRPWVMSAALLVRGAARLLERLTPDICLVSSGRTLPSACIVAAAAARNIRVVTWDTEPSFADGLVLSHNQAAPLIPLDDVWPECADRPLGREQRQALHEFLERWARGENTPHPYNRHADGDPVAIRAQLGLRSNAPLIVAYGNSAWDTAALDRDVGFASMFEWLFALVRYARHHPDVDLVIRAHPSETNVAPDLRSRTPVAEEIRRRAGPLPANVVLVESDSGINSYALADLAQVVTVYASRIGLERALTGQRVWVCGDTTYRGKGFTRDIASWDEMSDLLDARRFDERLSGDDVDRAERFAYLWLFRYVTRSALLRPAHMPFDLKTFRDLGPDGDRVLHRMCLAIENGLPFHDLGETVA